MGVYRGRCYSCSNYTEATKQVDILGEEMLLCGLCKAAFELLMDNKRARILKEIRNQRKREEK